MASMASDDERRHRRHDRVRSPRRSRRRSPPEDGRRHHRRRPSRSRSPPVIRKRRSPLPSQQDSFAVTTRQPGDPADKPKEKPNWAPSGRLAALANSVAHTDGSSTTLKYHEPAEARKPPPRDRWRLFVFKGSDVVDTVDLGARSCWLVGRDEAVADLPAAHPSVSKQHAVIQFRHTERRNEFGDRVGGVRPYLIDLESANGSVLNGERVPESRYLEVRDKDVVRFGHSSREYVVMLGRD